MGNLAMVCQQCIYISLTTKPCGGIPVSPAQTPSRNVIIYFWLGLIQACTIWSNIVCLRIGWESPSGSLTLPIQIITPWFEYWMWNYWREHLFAAFLDWIGFILTLLQPLCERRGPTGPWVPPQGSTAKMCKIQ